MWMKVRSRELSKEDRIRTLDALYTAAGTVKGRAAMKTFLRDLLTESERIMMGRRILVARALLRGSTYEDIAAEMHVGNSLVRRVDIWLHDQMPGYETAIADMEKEFVRRNAKAKDRRMYAKSALYRLKKKYPIHFLLFPWPKE
jgi:uncharacterized protein YerC